MFCYNADISIGCMLMIYQYVWTYSVIGQSKTDELTNVHTAWAADIDLNSTGIKQFHYNVKYESIVCF